VAQPPSFSDEIIKAGDFRAAGNHRKLYFSSWVDAGKLPRPPGFTVVEYWEKWKP